MTKHQAPHTFSFVSHLPWGHTPSIRCSWGVPQFGREPLVQSTHTETILNLSSLEEDFSWAPSKQSTVNMISLFLPESSQKSLLFTEVNSNAFSPLLLLAMWIKDDTLTPHTQQAGSSVALRLYNPPLHFCRTGNKIYLVDSSPFSLNWKHFLP